MLEIPVYNREGKEIERLTVEPEQLGGEFRAALVKQAIVMYHANRRQGSATTRSRGMVTGSTRKLYRQKGTGNARVGNIRTCVRRGGGVAFAKLPRDFSQRMPRKQRRQARNSAILAKIESQDALVIDTLGFGQPKTREFATILNNLKIDRSCLVATEQYDENIYKSLRNIPKVDMLRCEQLNAGDIVNHRKLLFTRAAWDNLIQTAKVGSKEAVAAEVM